MGKIETNKLEAIHTNLERPLRVSCTECVMRVCARVSVSHCLCVCGSGSGAALSAAVD